MPDKPKSETTGRKPTNPNGTESYWERLAAQREAAQERQRRREEALKRKRGEDKTVVMGPHLPKKPGENYHGQPLLLPPPKKNSGLLPANDYSEHSLANLHKKWGFELPWT